MVGLDVFPSFGLFGDFVAFAAFGDLVCLAIGGDPSLVSNPLMAELDAWLTLSGRNCENEFLVQKETITKLIEPYLVNPNQPLPRIQ